MPCVCEPYKHNKLLKAKTYSLPNLNYLKSFLEAPNAIAVLLLNQLFVTLVICTKI